MDTDNEYSLKPELICCTSFGQLVIELSVFNLVLKIMDAIRDTERETRDIIEVFLRIRCDRLETQLESMSD